MSKIAFFGISARGHLNPAIDVLQELRDAGHELHVFGYRSTAKYLADYGISVTCLEDVLPAGAPLSPFEQDPLTVARGTSQDHPSERREFFTELTHEVTSNVPHYRALLGDLDPDCVIHLVMHPGPRYAAQSLGIPLVTSGTMAISPKAWLSTPDPETAARIRADFGMLREVTAPLQALRAELGLTGPPNPVDVFNVSQELVLAYTSRSFQGDYDENRPYEFVGYTPPRATAATAEVELGPAPRVYVSLGTQAEPAIAHRFFEGLVEAARSTSASFLVATGASVRVDDLDLPANVTAASWVPQARLMPEVDAVVCHGGFNTVHEAMYHGKPAWALMLDNDDFQVGRCLAESGAGIATALRDGRVDAHSIQQTVAELLKSEAMRAAAGRVRDSFTAAGGSAAARGAIEKICASR